MPFFMRERTVNRKVKQLNSFQYNNFRSQKKKIVMDKPRSRQQKIAMVGSEESKLKKLREMLP